MGSDKRRSLQALFIPGFLAQIVEPEPVATVRPQRPQLTQWNTWGYSATRHSPPPDFLLDDDPFAKFEPPAAPKKSEIPAAARSPRRSAFQKPAFPSRPSLPSLATLANMNVIVPPRIPSGRIGAQLPPEPWLDETLPSTPSDSVCYDSSRTSSSSEQSWSSSCESLVEDDQVNIAAGDGSSENGGGELQELLLDHHHFDLASHTTTTADWLYSDTDSEQGLERQPGSSSTVRASTVPGDTRSSLQTMWNNHNHRQPSVAADSSEWNARQSSGSRWTQSNGHSSSRPWSSSRNGYSDRNDQGHNAGDDGRDPRKPHTSRPSFPSMSSSSSESSSEDDDDDDVDDSDFDPRPKASASSDDDVPLARSIPTALKAQRTIRIRAREERDQRRKDRAERERARQTTLRPNASQPPPAALREPLRQPTQRQRAQTLATNSNSFAVEDLSRRLQDVQAGDSQRRRGHTTYDDERVVTSVPSSSPRPPLRDPPRSLRPMRSFHYDRSPEPGTEPERLSRTKSRTNNDYARSASRPPPALPPEPEVIPDMERLSRSKSRTSHDVRGASRPPPPLPHEPEPLPDLERKPTRLVKERPRPSADAPRPSLPPAPMHMSKSSFSQQRIFVGDMQTFHMVEVNASTTAGDVVKLVQDGGGFKGWVGSGSWMVYEVAQDFGMERPVRHFELLSDVEASWNKDKTVNTFILKLTTLEPLLGPSAIPSSSPVASGYVEWEMKRGKWTKRWLVLREHNLYLAKRDNGKDEVFLCSLSNFDFYKVTRTIKAPKPFVFAIKSTDNLSYFEDTADYLHMFSCNERDAAKWTEKILVARSYVLFKERNVLFKSTNTPATPPTLSRAPTRKSTTSTRNPARQQTLVNMNADKVFEPGSLLGK